MDNLVIFLAKYLVFIIALIAALYWLGQAKRTKIQLAAAVIIAAVTALVLVKLAGKLYYHPRPFAAEHIRPLIPHANDNGFPSEHTTYATAITSTLYFYRRKLAAYLFVLTLLVGLGRVLAHVHSPVDILGGLVIGLMAGLTGHYLAKRFFSAPKTLRPNN